MVKKRENKNIEEYEPTTMVHLISSDNEEEEEGNEDLSLKIVEKSLLRACQGTTSETQISLDDDVAVVKTPKRKLKKKEKNKKKQQIQDYVEVGMKDKDAADIIEAVESAEKDPAEKSDSLVLRKLLRGPRYFDPPDSGSGWGACYNCGEEGHTLANCTSAKRSKPCFICGSLEHHVKQCMKGQDCYICQKGGHRAKDCPEKYKGVSKFWKICLKCGDSGHHDMFSCKNYYSPEDLKGIQCYICRSFGHLCCADLVNSSPVELSCYRCGQLGHSGLDCRKSYTEKTVVRSHAKCYECQEVGHIAKNCPSSVKDCGESRSKLCFTCGKEGHIARECLQLNEVGKKNFELSTPSQKFSGERVKFKKAKYATSENLKAQKRKNAEFVENRSPRPFSFKKRGGWVTEDPEVVFRGETQARQWDSPVTPIYSKNMSYISGVNGREYCVNDTQYESIASYRRDPSDQPCDQYGHGPSSEPYRHYKHVPSNESYHQFEHASPNGSYRQREFVPSSRPHHRYVASPPDLPSLAYADGPSNGPPPFNRSSQPHHPYGPSLSHEAARAHHQSYMPSGSPIFPQQRYPSRFHN